MISTIFTIIIVFCSSNAWSWDAEVVDVRSINCVNVKINKKSYTDIYLYGIEKNKYKNKNTTTKKLKELVLNKKVKIKNIDLDKYGHINSIIYLDGISINEELVKSGHAIVNQDTCTQDFCNKWISFQKNESNKSEDIKKNKANLYIGDYETGKFHTMLCHDIEEIANYIVFNSRQKSIDNGFIPCIRCARTTILKDGMYYVTINPMNTKITSSQDRQHNIFKTNTEKYALRLESDIRNLEKNRRMNEINDPFSGVNLEILSKRKQLTEIRKAQALTGN